MEWYALKNQIQTVKKRLKSIGLIYDVNSSVKDIMLTCQSARIRGVYDRKIQALSPAYPDADIRSLIRRRMRNGGVREIRQPKGRMHVFCVGTYYEQEAAGFLQGLARFGRVSVYRNAEGGYGLNAPPGTAPHIVRDRHERCLIEQVRGLHAEHRIDVVIGTMVAQSLTVDALRAVRESGIPVLNIAMDDRLPVHWGSENGVRNGAIGLADGVDLVLNTTKEYVPRYLSEGCPAIYWPFGSDPEIFHPSEGKEYDVCFVGNNYGTRSKLVNAITSVGIRIESFGHGFPNGHISAERVPEVFAKSKVILGTGLVGHSRRIFTLKLRDFDGPMSGSLYVTSYNPDLAEHFEFGKEIIVYKSIPECIEQLRFYLAHDLERERIAVAGRIRAMREHTWEQRLSLAFGSLSDSTAC